MNPSWYQGEEAALQKQVVKWLNLWRSQKKGLSSKLKKYLINIEISCIVGQKTSSCFSCFFYCDSFLTRFIEKIHFFQDSLVDVACIKHPRLFLDFHLWVFFSRIWTFIQKIFILKEVIPCEDAASKWKILVWDFVILIFDQIILL